MSLRQPSEPKADGLPQRQKRMATSGKNRPDPPIREREHKDIHPWREKKGLIADAECQCSFLTEEFHDIKSIDLPDCEISFGQVSKDGKIQWKLRGNVIVDADKNISSLERSVRQYCIVHNATFDFQRTANPMHDLSTLFSIVQSMKPEDVEIAIDYDDSLKQLVFVEYRECDFDYYTVFFLPVSFIEKLPEDLKSLAEKLCGYVSTVCGLNAPEDHMDLSFALGMWDNDLEEEMDPEDFKEYDRFIQDYRNGYIHSLIDRCTQFPDDEKALRAELSIKIQKYNGSPLGDMLKLFDEGFTLTDIDSLQRYYLNPNRCWIPEYDTGEDSTIDQDRLFAVVYDMDDPIADRAVDCLNTEAGSLELSAFYDRRVITNNLNEPMMKSDFPIKWCQWFRRLIQALDNIK